MKPLSRNGFPRRFPVRSPDGTLVPGEIGRLEAFSLEPAFACDRIML